MSNPDDLLTIDEAAAALRMSKTSFRRRLDRGEFTVIRDRRLVLVPRSALDAYLQRHTRTGPVTAIQADRPEGRRAPTPRRTLVSRDGRVRHLWDGAAS